MSTLASKAYTGLQENLEQVDRLIKIHASITGEERGRRFGVEVLNKSAIVLITSCWEAFAEDMAKESFEFLLENAEDWEIIPVKVRLAASKSLRSDNDETKVWKLAGLGWRSVLQNYKSALIDNSVGRFNTPKADKIDELFKNLIGIPRLSESWYWQKMSRDDARKRLDQLVTMRGSIAHRVTTANSVTKKKAEDYRKFIRQISVKSSNFVRDYIYSIVRKNPWNEVPF